MNVGVLALQGDVPEHRAALERLPVPPVVTPVRSPADLALVDALVLPGGESTTIAHLLQKTGLWTALHRRLASGFPVLATCAGLIVLAREIEPSPGGRDPPTLGVLDVLVRRNDYGRQRESFEGPVAIAGMPAPPFPGVFIRAPRILKVGTGARTIAKRGAEVVGVRSGNVVGLTFHPELATDPRLHSWFLKETLGHTQNR
jgi:5'-phosphate synthase pdxT subunit